MLRKSLKCNVDTTTVYFVAVKTSAVCQSPALAIQRQVTASWPSSLLLVLVQKLQTAGILHFLVTECLSVCFSHRCIYSWEVYNEMDVKGLYKELLFFYIYFMTMHW